MMEHELYVKYVIPFKMQYFMLLSGTETKILCTEKNAHVGKNISMFITQSVP